MRDRQPTPGREGRVKIVGPYGDVVAGTLQMDDDPLDEGTPFNKSTMLKDATAALYGLTNTAVPDDVFAFLGKYNQYWWRRRTPGGVSIVDGDTVQTYNLGAGYSETRNITVTYSPEAEIVDGNIKIKTEQTLTATYATYTVFEELRGKFIMASEVGSDSDVLVKAKENATVTQRTQSGVYYVDIEATIPKIESIPPGEWEYLYSSDRSAYPDSGEQDGYEYQYLGIPFENAVGAPKIETGSYVGTGTYGTSESNAVHLTFPFPPKLVIVNSNAPTVFIYGNLGGVTYVGGSSGGYYQSKWDGNSLKFWLSSTRTWHGSSSSSTGADASDQLNSAGNTYPYIAIG